jgi:hypothetical protein
MKLSIFLLTFFYAQYIFANENDPYNQAYDSNNVGLENNDGAFDPNEQSRQPSNYNEGYEDSSNGPNQNFAPFEPE